MTVTIHRVVEAGTIHRVVEEGGENNPHQQEVHQQ
jgi:hypothetical protein